MHQGLKVMIENPKGSIRSGVDKDGTPWKTVMKMPYGFLHGTKGADGEEIDVYVGPKKDASHAYVVHQRKVDGKGYDEDKIMLGQPSKEHAIKAYLQHYDDPKFLGPVKEVPIDRLKALIESGKKLRKISSVSLWAMADELAKLANNPFDVETGGHSQATLDAVAQRQGFQNHAHFQQHQAQVQPQLQAKLYHAEQSHPIISQNRGVGDFEMERQALKNLKPKPAPLNINPHELMQDVAGKAMVPRPRAVVPSLAKAPLKGAIKPGAVTGMFSNLMHHVLLFQRGPHAHPRHPEAHRPARRQHEARRVPRGQ